MRATLYILGGRSVGRSFVVEDSAVIGREPSCQIRLADKSISRRHARITWDGFRWRVEDLDSRNGVHLGKRRVREANLVDCDEFMLGEVPVRLRIEEEISPPVAQDLEFEDDSLADPKPTTAPQPTSPQEDEIVLEEEIELGSPVASPGAARLSLERRPGGALAPERVQNPVSLREAPASRLQKDLDPRAMLLAKNKKRGLLGGDLTQQPAWVLGLLFLVLAILMAAVGYLVFGVVQSL